MRKRGKIRDVGVALERVARSAFCEPGCEEDEEGEKPGCAGCEGEEVEEAEGYSGCLHFFFLHLGVRETCERNGLVRGESEEVRK